MISSKLELSEMKQRERIEAQALREAWAEVLSSPHGRRVLEDVISELRGGPLFRTDNNVFRLSALHDAADALEQKALDFSPESGRLLLEERTQRRIEQIQFLQLAESSKR